jgi:hypothetical protein
MLGLGFLECRTTRTILILCCWRGRRRRRCWQLFRQGMGYLFRHDTIALQAGIDPWVLAGGYFIGAAQSDVMRRVCESSSDSVKKTEEPSQIIVSIAPSAGSLEL